MTDTSTGPGRSTGFTPTDEDVGRAAEASPIHHVEMMSDGHPSLIIHDDEEAARIVLATIGPIVERERRAAKAEALRGAAESLADRTEGIDRAGTAGWPECDRNAYSLAIEEAKARLCSTADERAAAEPMTDTSTGPERDEVVTAVLEAYKAKGVVIWWRAWLAADAEKRRHMEVAVVAAMNGAFL